MKKLALLLTTILLTLTPFARTFAYCNLKGKVIDVATKEIKYYLVTKKGTPIKLKYGYSCTLKIESDKTIRQDRGKGFIAHRLFTVSCQKSSNALYKAYGQYYKLNIRAETVEPAILELYTRKNKGHLSDVYQVAIDCINP